MQRRQPDITQEFAMSAQLKSPVPAPVVRAAKANGHAARIRHTGFHETQAIGSLDELRVQLGAARAGKRGENHGVRLGELLLHHALISPGDLRAALDASRRAKRRLGDQLVESGAVSVDIMRLVLAEQFGYPVVDLKRIALHPEALLKMPAALCQELNVLPLALLNDRLVIAIADPSDTKTMKAVQFAAHAQVDFVVARADDLERAIARFYGKQGMDAAAESAEAKEEGELGADVSALSLRALEEDATQSPVVRLLNHVLLDAIRRNASDIHIRPEEQSVQLLFRIDGQMVPIRTVARSVLPALVSRVKVIGRMDVANRQTPQDGSARIADGARSIDLRISVIPTVKGESVTIRVLNGNSLVATLDDLGFSAANTHMLHDALQRTNGMILVTGPTGSGKSTTLHTALAEVVKRKVTVMSVEDPVERQLDGVEQISINPATGLTFPTALRSILRHDPNVIMVGEIRDHETAKLALESALTGHLVLSTLHTNSAAAAIPRFLEMGIEPYVVASTISLVLAQRLIRLNCTYCLSSEVVSDQMRETLGVGPRERFTRGVGCSHCNGTGYGARRVVYEMLPVTEAIREATLAHGSAESLNKVAIAEGLVPLSEQALELARTRRTSLAEVYRVRLG
jgi:type IV pilus assembly protein PilB